MAPWSLQRRITLLFCLLSAIPVAATTVLGVSYLQQSVATELDALVREELEEARSAIAVSEHPTLTFPETVQEFALSHPNVRMGWRLLRTSDASIVGEFGEKDLLRHVPPPAPEAIPDHATVEQAANGLLTATIRSTDTLSTTLVLDGSQRIESIQGYWLVGLGSLILGMIVSVIASRFLLWRFRSLLDSIATQLRGGETGADNAQSLPIELTPIATELETMLDNVRSRANKAKVFTAGLAHELRSPLQNLIGEAEVAMLRARSPEDYQSLLQSQLSELHDFARSVDNLLYLCSASEPVHEPPTESFDLADEVAVRLAAERRLADSADVAFVIKTTGDTRLTADREAVVRAVRNLVNNAIKWSAAGDTVRLNVRDEGESIAVEVHDQGPGIPAAERERVFTPFAQGSVPSGKRAGFGLGLAITQATAQQHNGSITIEASPEGGALMRLVLPRQLDS